MSSQVSSRLVYLIFVLIALVGFLSGLIVGPYLNPRYITKTITTTHLVKEVKTITMTRATTVTEVVRDVVTLTVTETRTMTLVPTRTVVIASPKPTSRALYLGIGESKTFTFSMSTCRYRVVEVLLDRGATIVVEWNSNRRVFVGVGTKQDLDTWLSNTLCLTAHTTFDLDFTSSGYGYSGRITYTAPYTGTHYVVVFTGWAFGSYTADITLRITRTG